MASRIYQRRTWGRGRGPGARARARLGMALVLIVSFSGCGYTVRNSLPSHLKTLAIPVFANNTVENRDLWREDALTVRTTYNVVSVAGQPAQTELDGRKDVIQKLADQIVSRTVQGW